MVGEVNIKRQLRYKDSIYDILKDIDLGGHNYLIIGKCGDSKFYDIDFVEQKFDNDKIRYVSSITDYQFSDTVDFIRLQGQNLMNHIINVIKDDINQGRLNDILTTTQYIDNLAKEIENNNDIKTFFENNNFYENEEQFDESIKTLISYYDKSIKDYYDDKVIIGEEVVGDETLEKTYKRLEEELGNTQNFGVSLISDSLMKSIKSGDDYMIDPTNSFVDINIDNSKQQTGFNNAETENNDIKHEEIETNRDNDLSTSSNIDTTVENTIFEKNDSEIEIKEKDNNSNLDGLSFQERLYLENEAKLNNNLSGHNNDLQSNLDMKQKTLTLKSNNYSRMNNAAYISITALLYLIGSFELLLSIVLLVKYL